MNRLLKAKQMADILQVDVQTVYRYGREGKLSTVQIGRTVRFEPISERIKQNDTERTDS